MTNVLISEVLATGAGIAPSSQAVGALATTGAIMANARKVLHTLMVGALGGAGTVDMKVQASVDNVNWTDIPGGAIAQINAAYITAGGAPIAQIEVRADRLNALNLGQYLRTVVTVGGNAVPTCLVVQGGDTRYLLASDYNLAGMPTAILI